MTGPIDEIDVLELYAGVSIMSVEDDGTIAVFDDDECFEYDPGEII
jgi:hypothetical protein